MLRWRDDDSGAVLVFTAFLLIMLLGFAALAVDLGNAWSANRKAQTSTDVAVMGALQKVPYTWLDAPDGGAEAIATAEAEDLIAVNGGDVVSIEFDLGDGESNVIMRATATTTSENTFARAFGGGDLIVTEGAATGEVLINQPSLDVLPIGITGFPNRFQCVATGPGFCTFTTNPPPSVDAQLIGMRRKDQACEDKEDTLIADFLVGADHLIDFIDSGFRPESDQSQCAARHALTMPSAARGPISASGGMITQGIGGRLGTNATPLWELLQANLPAPCNKTAIESGSSLEEQSSLMALCLSSGDPIFVGGLINSPRAGFALDVTYSGENALYVDSEIVWLHTVITDDGTGSPVHHLAPPGGGLEGFTLYILDADMLSDTIEFGPGGLENLEFRLTN